jgi:Asp/Glu/hydantoin racemase
LDHQLAGLRNISQAKKLGKSFGVVTALQNHCEILDDRIRLSRLEGGLEGLDLSVLALSREGQFSRTSLRTRNLST